MNIKETLDMIRSLHIPGQDAIADRLVKICEKVDDQKFNQDPTTQKLFETTIEVLVERRDRQQINEEVEELSPEQRKIYDAVAAMDDEQLRNLLEKQPHLREQVAGMLWYRSELERLVREQEEDEGFQDSD